MTDKKVLPLKKRFRPNFAFFIFLLIIIYIAVLGWNYMTKEHISIYEVNTSEISDDSAIYGFVMRNEEVVNTETGGYINYYNSEGSRIGTGDVVYTVDSNGEVSNMLEKIQTSQSATQNISTMREAIASFQNSFSLSSYNQVSDFKFDVQNVLFEQSRGSLYSDLKKSLSSSGLRKDFTKVTAAKSGVIAYSIDGFEGTTQNDITADLFDKYGSISRKQVQSDDTVKAGSPVYKLVTSNDWSIVVKMDDTYYKELKKLESVRVTVEKDDISFNASITLFDKDGFHFARLSTSRYMERYINDRFLKIEFNIKSASGLKIPNSSILKKDYYVVPANVAVTSGKNKELAKQTVNKEGKIAYEHIALSDYDLRNGNYYISEKKLTGGDVLLNGSDNSTYIVHSKEAVPGVYCVNQGYCEYKPIDIQYQNKEYTIIAADTKGGLSAYDHIVVDPAKLNDDDFIE